MKRKVKAFFKNDTVSDEAIEIISNLVDKYGFDLKRSGEHLKLYAEHSIEYAKLKRAIDKIRLGTYKNKSKAPLSKIFERANQLNTSRENILKLLFTPSRGSSNEDKPRRRKKTKSEKAAEDFGI